MLVGREGTSNGWPKLASADAKVMKALGIDRFADTPLADCTLATQQRAEIARAVARDAQVFLFDEPNSALTDEESDELFREMHKLAAEGRIVLLVTHRLGDLFEHASRVAVIRDGRVRAILEGDTLTEDGIAQQLVVGRGGETNVKPAPRSIMANELSRLRPRLVPRRRLSQRQPSTPSPAKSLRWLASRAPAHGSCCVLLPGWRSCSGEIDIAGETGEGAQRLSAYVPATRMLSLYSNFSVGENLLVRLGARKLRELAWR